MKNGSGLLMKIICILFIVTASLSLFVSVIALIGAIVHTVQAGILHSFVSLGTSLLDIAYSLSVLLVAIWAMRKKHLDTCFSVGVVLSLWSIIRMTIFISNSYIHSNLDVVALISYTLDIVMAVIFTYEVDRMMKYLKSQILPQPAMAEELASEGKTTEE